jgi:hypothetical protein
LCRLDKLTRQRQLSGVAFDARWQRSGSVLAERISR